MINTYTSFGVDAQEAGTENRRIPDIANGIGSALLGLILEIGGYVGTAAVQTESALTSIKICFVWIPIAVYVCGLVIMKFYHLDKEFAGIIEDLKKRTQK